MEAQQRGERLVAKSSAAESPQKAPSRSSRDPISTVVGSDRLVDDFVALALEIAATAALSDTPYSEPLEV